MTIHIKRSPFNKGIYNVYVPSGGGLYTRFTLSWPTPTEGFVNSYPLQSSMVGKLYDGKAQNIEAATPVGGAMGNLAYTDGWARRTIVSDRSCTFTIPAGHNRIHVLTCPKSGAGGALVSWSDDSTTGLDLTTLPRGTTSYTCIEYVVATNAIDPTKRTLKLKQETSGLSACIIGVRSWNTNLIVSATESGIADGDDFIDYLSSTGSNSTEWTSITGCYKLLTSNTVEVTVQWEPAGTGGDGCWTAYGAHTNSSESGNAPFILKPPTSANQTLTFTDNPSANDTITITDGTNTDIYEFDGVGANINVAIGVDAAATIVTLLAAIVASGTAAVTAANDGLAVTVTADATGIAGNDLEVTEDADNVTIGDLNLGVDNYAVLYVDGVYKGIMDDIVAIPLGTTYEANTAYTQCRGFGDFDRNGSQGATDVLEMVIQQMFSQSGIMTQTQMCFIDDVTIKVGPYAPSLTIPLAERGHIIALPDRTRVPLDPTYDYTAKFYANEVELFYKGKPFFVKIFTNGPLYQNQKQSNTNKMYFRIDNAILEPPVAGVIWPAIGGGIQVLAKSNFYAAMGAISGGILEIGP